MSAPAKFATAGDPKRRTLGGAIALVAEALGKPLMPWQRQVADVATELDDRGRLVYEIVLVTVPRQSGKTTLIGAMQLHRAMTTPNVRCFYTAQTGKDARTRFEDLVNLVQGSALTAIAKPRWSAGSESILFPNGSSVRLFAPTFDAIHGETPPLVVFDEIWKYDQMLGDALLEGAVLPAQMTLSGRRQVWMISTAGTALSTFMKGWVERGREAVKSGGKAWPKLAYFEWSLADGDDPDDPTAYERFHPACGYTVTAEELAESAPASRAERLRAMFNVWTEAEDPLFSADQLKAVTARPKAVPSRREVAVTYAIADGGTDGAVFATWRDVDGVPCSRLLHAAPGTVWMHPFIVQLVRDWQPKVVGADNGGKTRRLTDRLRKTFRDEGREIVTTQGAEFSTACDQSLEAIRTKDARLDGSKTILNGYAHLVEKRTGDVTSFSRDRSTGSIVGPECFAVGLWLYDHADADDGSFLIR